jgi:hypothetical protein
MTRRSCLLALGLLTFGLRAQAAVVPPAGPARLEALVEANITGIHAYQIGLSRKDAQSDPACWPKDVPTATALEALEEGRRLAGLSGGCITGSSLGYNIAQTRFVLLSNNTMGAQITINSLNILLMTKLIKGSPL